MSFWCAIPDMVANVKALAMWRTSVVRQLGTNVD